MVQRVVAWWKVLRGERNCCVVKEVLCGAKSCCVVEGGASPGELWS